MASSDTSDGYGEADQRDRNDSPLAAGERRDVAAMGEQGEHADGKREQCCGDGFGGVEHASPGIGGLAGVGGHGYFGCVGENCVKSGWIEG